MILYRPTNFSWMLTTMCILGHEKVHIWPLSKSQKCPQSTIVTYMLICDQSLRTWRRWCFPWPEQLTCSSHTRVANLVGLATENINRTYSENHTKNNHLPRKGWWYVIKTYKLVFALLLYDDEPSQTSISNENLLRRSSYMHIIHTTIICHSKGALFLYAYHTNNNCLPFQRGANLFRRSSSLALHPASAVTQPHLEEVKAF